MPVPTQAGDSAKWSKSQEVKGLAWQMERLSAMLLDAKPGVSLPRGWHPHPYNAPHPPAGLSRCIMSAAAYLNNNVRILCNLRDREPVPHQRH
jgi:hypothetical protein